MACPYYKEEYDRGSKFYCEAKDGYVDYDRFKRYCYPWCDFRDCPTWTHEYKANREYTRYDPV